MSLEFREYHDCQKPSMVVGTIEHTWTTGVWPFKFRHSETYDKLETRSARWTCPVCRSEWSWHPPLIPEKPWSTFGGRWEADRRNYEWVKKSRRRS